MDEGSAEQTLSPQSKADWGAAGIQQWKRSSLFPSNKKRHDIKHLTVIFYPKTTLDVQILAVGFVSSHGRLLHK